MPLLKAILFPFIALWVAGKVIYRAVRYRESPLQALRSMSEEIEPEVHPAALANDVHPPPFKPEHMEAGEQLRQLLYEQTRVIEGTTVVFKQRGPFQSLINGGLELCALYPSAPMLDQASLKSALETLGTVKATEDVWQVSFGSAAREDEHGQRLPLVVEVSRYPLLVDSDDWVDTESGLSLEPATARAELAAMHFMLRVRENNLGIAASFRVKALWEVLRAVAHVAPPTLIGCRNIHHVSPASDLQRTSDGAPIIALVKVLAMRVGNSDDGAMLVETRGLTFLGLPEIQVHFLRLDSQAIVRMVLDLAAQLVERGAYIKMGDTVAWGDGELPVFRASYEGSLRHEELVVLDLDGGAYAAGVRTQRQLLH